jgi:succinyl-diaminopimelate desuccinylase
MTHTAKLLCDLIALPSVNPAFLPARDPQGGEQAVAEFLAARASRAKLDVEFQPVLPKRNNLLIRLGPRSAVRHRLLLAPHLDTVGVEPGGAALFTPRRLGSRLHGRGACDTKASVAIMIEAICSVAQSSRRPAHTEIILVGLVDEECGQAGSRMLVANRFKADLAVVGEPTRLKVVTAHKGVLWFELRTHGKAAHGARPELGRNAVYLMARVIDALQSCYIPRLGRRRHGLLGTATLNVGSIQGGRQPNIVPAECRITVDRRTLPGETDVQVLGEIKALLRERSLKATLTRERPVACRPLETDPDRPWVRRLLALTRQRTPAGVDYFSDAGVLAAGGIPSVVFGPGDIAQAHTADEWIELAQLERGRELLERFLQTLP